MKRKLLFIISAFIVVGVSYGISTNAAKELVKHDCFDKNNLKQCNYACEFGSGLSCFHLGWLYEYGQGVPQNYLKADTLSEKACEMDSGTACSNLESLHKNRAIDDIINTAQIGQSIIQIGKILPKVLQDE
ncbi:tetratricopeptide repeat protein [Hydrogenobaculum acidophilum]